MTALGLLLAFCGFAALSLSMERHYEQVFDHAPIKVRMVILRAGGWLLLALAALPALDHAGTSVGLAVWAGELTVAAVVVMLVLSYAPRGLVWMVCLAPVSLLM